MKSFSEDTDKLQKPSGCSLLVLDSWFHWEWDVCARKTTFIIIIIIKSAASSNLKKKKKKKE